MYLRITQRQNRDGSTVSYYALAENAWNATAKRADFVGILISATGLLIFYWRTQDPPEFTDKDWLLKVILLHFIPGFGFYFSSSLWPFSSCANTVLQWTTFATSMLYGAVEKRAWLSSRCMARINNKYRQKRSSHQYHILTSLNPRSSKQGKWKRTSL